VSWIKRSINVAEPAASHEFQGLKTPERKTFKLVRFRGTVDAEGQRIGFEGLANEVRQPFDLPLRKRRNEFGVVGVHGSVLKDLGEAGRGELENAVAKVRTFEQLFSKALDRAVPQRSCGPWRAIESVRNRKPIVRMRIPKREDVLPRFRKLLERVSNGGGTLASFQRSRVVFN
jgi:hypothetical protein